MNNNDARQIIHISNDLCQVLEDLLCTLEADAPEVYDKVMKMYAYRILLVTARAIGWAEKQGIE